VLEVPQAEVSKARGLQEFMVPIVVAIGTLRHSCVVTMPSLLSLPFVFLVELILNGWAALRTQPCGTRLFPSCVTRRAFNRFTPAPRRCLLTRAVVHRRAFLSRHSLTPGWPYAWRAGGPQRFARHGQKLVMLLLRPFHGRTPLSNSLPSGNAALSSG
jgi:hypothetical protein